MEIFWVIVFVAVIVFAFIAFRSMKSSETFMNEQVAELRRAVAEASNQEQISEQETQVFFKAAESFALLAGQRRDDGYVPDPETAFDRQALIDEWSDEMTSATGVEIPRELKELLHYLTIDELRIFTKMGD